ncbi:folylpolyglutamate synthase/dihydrofolate synthase family protein [Gracilibacillus sp. S3-1-1]|uniref:Folylpolyglutamate synthase/dihydrofolate synthase family protein n=1 Tax=Gracilibacillus pellucidus TaxID=3095368 RepID=A0ACC6M6H1_9BACI|nr:folylpolyglutamate synthase/dihydrofolate synthase family protein [Gracilibacillus sp. S3-1-1]MDX8046573.1 folylpolyglutamate synthase/dihydrofolate synthase family protein [Gracilibacillus sp. S3-1-1]
MITSKQGLDDFFATRRKLGIKPGLGRLDYLLEKVNHPEKSLPTIHIAGTNGKGSTLTYLKETLMASGYTVGTFQSPGLPTIFDHIAINNKIITPVEFIQIINQLMPIIEQMDDCDQAPSEYEILMVVTLLYLKEQVDIAVIETCMGGREDVTNRVEPLLSIITTVAFDHTAFLGDTIEAIASHKAGIIKDNTPVIVGDLEADAFQVVNKEAELKKAPVYLYNKDFWIDEEGIDTFRWHNDETTYRVNVTMKGRHQMVNASLAIQALQLLRANGWNISRSAILQGIAQAKLANRMEWISENPKIIVDGAHNLQSIRKLVETIKVEADNSNIQILFSAFRDKDIHPMLNELSHLSNRITITTFDHPRALDKTDVPMSVLYIEHTEQALQQVLVNNHSEDILVITGSLHFVDYAKRLVKNIE